MNSKNDLICNINNLKLESLIKELREELSNNALLKCPNDFETLESESLSIDYIMGKMHEKALQPNSKFSSIEICGAKCRLTSRGKTEELDTVIFYHITDEEDYNFSIHSNKYNKTTFVTKRMNNTIIYNNSDLSTNIWNRYKVLSNGDILDKQYNLIVKPFKGCKIFLDPKDKSDISSVVYYDNDTYFIYPQDLGSYSSATYNISPIVNIDSWVIYYKTKDDNQFLAIYCPINDTHHFSIINSVNNIPLESLAINLIGMSSIELRQYFID